MQFAINNQPNKIEITYGSFHNLNVFVDTILKQSFKKNKRTFAKSVISSFFNIFAKFTIFAYELWNKII